MTVCKSMSLLCCSIFSFCSLTSLAQDSIRNDVFILSTCEPSNFSLIKAKESNQTSKEYISKLEVHSNRLSSIKITGINPLRYKYFINNAAVTQFMESSPYTFSLNSFTNGDYITGAPEIKIPEIFRTDSISTKVKTKIREFQILNKKLEDSIADINTKIDNLWAEVQYKVYNKDRKKDSIARSNAYYKKLDANNHLQKLLNKYRALHDLNLANYQTFTGGLPLNNPRFSLLDQYKGINLNIPYNEEIDSIRSFQKDFAEQYFKHHRKFDTISMTLKRFEESRFSSHAAFRDLMGRLLYYNFSWAPLTERSKLDSEAYYLDNISNVHEQILDKRFQLYEEFVLNIAMRVGVLVQNQFREYSSLNNALENYSCIDENMVDSIKRQRNKLIRSFEFIQLTSAQLQILVSYLDINTELYQSIAKKINNNYLFLLSYLKNLDFLIQENTKQFTLPTHGNLKNIDLIRYTIAREDRITKTKQEYNYDFWLKGGLKIDFSFGIFGTRLTDNLYNKVLLDTLNGIDRIRITRKDDGRASFAFGGMVNLIKRNGASWINWGGSVGIAYSDSKNLQMLTGLLLSLGKTERILVHAGAAFGTIKYLDVSANDFQFYKYEGENTNLKQVTRDDLPKIKERDRVYMLESPDIKFSSFTIPTVDKFVIRPFIGVTYNLSKKNALQAVSGTGVKTFSDNYTNGVTY